MRFGAKKIYRLGDIVDANEEQDQQPNERWTLAARVTPVRLRLGDLIGSDGDHDRQAA